jgi:hydrogenase maturation protein HypF
VIGEAPAPMSAAGALTRRRLRLRVDGTVQGVGFRPYVFRLAGELGLGGWVRNDERGVVLEVEGDGGAVDRFLARLPAEAPPLARVERVLPDERAPTGERAFAIVASEQAGAAGAPVTADAAACAACLAELFDPTDRRHRYPFVNCTDCGPRFTIVRGVPYDRARTTMAAFAMCAACRAEYEDPADRRFHAEPNACPACGPSARLVGAEGGDPVRAAADALRAGSIVAVKGLGGYHLACRADDEDAVAALRARKHREDKPFALMAAGLDAARALVELTPEDEAALLGHERPIVLARRRATAPVAAAVAPRSPDLGVMLPYTPLHHLLLADTGATLVMTSGNVADEPIAYEDDEALARLAGVADLFLVHDRPIHMRTDDSIVRSGRLLRRSRGHVPDALALPLDAPPTLAVGAELKSAFCLARGRRAWVGHHIGDLRTWETLRSFREGVAHFERLFEIAPQVVAHDLHPDYLATAYALEREGVAHVGVQHHHAHLAACLAEHGYDAARPALGAIYDGTGHGTDGTAWGGELLCGDLRDCDRVGHLWPVRLPGGDRAAREPWRMACAWLVAAELPTPAEWEPVARMARTGFAAPVTTSAGRLFDAVSALCGVRKHATYEGQAAAELEGVADVADRGAYPLPFAGGVLDARETIRAVVADLARGATAPAVSARFHRALAEGTARACAQLAEHGTVVLSGGVFQNRLLLEWTRDALEDAGLRVLVPRALPANDGGIAYGQAAVAAARLA